MWKSIKSWVEGDSEVFDFDRLSAAEEKAAKVSKSAAPAKKGGKKQAKSSANIADTLFKVVSVLTAAVLLWVMLAIVFTLPLFGTGVTTANELSGRYIEQGMAEVGAQNLVANIIMVYRGFDTFGESTVLFTAATCVIFLLHGVSAGNVLTDERSKKNTVILKTVVKGMFPFLLVFAVYILLNGHLSPGGGFSGGAVLGAGLILLDIALGTETLGRFFNHTVYTVIKVGALVIYCAIILYLVICGANGINNGISAGIAGNIFSAGVILPINLMVGFEVACTMYAFYTYFYRGELK